MNSEQNYEEYWKITNAFTDYNGDKFLNALRVCVQFIDENAEESYSDQKYKRLQKMLVEKAGITDVSVRKAINQLVKMGFISTFLADYPKESLHYIDAKTNRKRKSLLSKIVYSYSSFNRSVTNDSDLRHLNFLINTLVEVGKLNRSDIVALMLVDIKSSDRDFISRDELDLFVSKAEEIQFMSRKYNQIGYLTNLLSKLDEIVFVGDELYFTEDAIQIFGEALEEKETRKRNPYLHLLYKNQLKEESALVFNKESCMVEKIPYPILIASHIKPFVKSSEEEAYDPDNGILLSQNMDGLFDKGYISFTDEGELIISQKLDIKLQEHLSEYKLDVVFLGDNRKHYLQFHRELFKERLCI